jgi:hypothetical protein
LSKATNQTREALLKALYERGVRKVHVSPTDHLTVTSRGHLGSSDGQNAFFQALQETDDGYNLSDWSGSKILDDQGNLLATVVVTSGIPDLSYTSVNSLKVLYELGLRSFKISLESRVTVERDEKSELKLK